ncbi:AIR synthase related protein, partial [Myxococcota bacterium]|nr:AIR synthase related protein [Myxococcota bacterium]
GGDAGVLLVEGARFGLAVSVDCPNRYVALDPYEGGKMTVAEAARNVACTGALPLGITNCLNFGNPDKPESFFQFREAVRGMGDACRAFETPVTGGNVSLYNESPTGAIDPTPTVGMVGLLDDVTCRVPSAFQREGDLIAVLGTTRGHLGGSLYWAVVNDFLGGPPPPCEMDHVLWVLLCTASTPSLPRSTQPQMAFMLAPSM